MTVAEPPPTLVSVDLRPGQPDLSAYPRQAWQAAERAALARTPDSALGYGDPRGTREQRVALAPALRLGWVVAPTGVREELVVRKQWSDITSPALGQLALAELLTSGGFERHLRRVRVRQRGRRDALLAALREHLPSARVHGVAAGLHLLVGLPDGIDDAAVAERVLAAGVAVQPLSYHRLRPGPPGLVIGYAAVTPDRLWEGVRLLAKAVPGP